MKLKLDEPEGLLNTTGSTFVRFRSSHCCVMDKRGGKIIWNRTGLYSTGLEEKNEWGATPGWIEGVISRHDEDAIVLIK